MAKKSTTKGDLTPGTSKDGNKSALKIKLFPNKDQQSKLESACWYRNKIYNAFVDWYRDMRSIQNNEFQAWCLEHPEPPEEALNRKKSKKSKSEKGSPDNKSSKKKEEKQEKSAYEKARDKAVGEIYTKLKRKNFNNMDCNATTTVLLGGASSFIDRDGDLKYPKEFVSIQETKVPVFDDNGDLATYIDDDGKKKALLRPVVLECFNVAVNQQVRLNKRLMFNSEIDANLKKDFASAVQKTKNIKKLAFKSTKDTMTFSLGKNSYTFEPHRITLTLGGQKQKDPSWKVSIPCDYSEKLYKRSSNFNTVTIHRDKVGTWWASLTCTQEPLPKKKRAIGMEAGIDLGIKTNVAVAYNTEDCDNAEYDKFLSYNFNKDRLIAIEDKIKYLSRQKSLVIKNWWKNNIDGNAKGTTLEGKGELSATRRYLYGNKELGIKPSVSKKYKTLEKRIAVLSRYKANILTNIQYRVVASLAKKFDSIGMEDLNVKAMMQKAKAKESRQKCDSEVIKVARRKSPLAKSLGRLGLSTFKTKVEHKFPGKHFHKLNKWAPSTSLCSYCNKQVSFTLKDHSAWVCPECGKTHKSLCDKDGFVKADGRDLNAASNIRPSRQPICEKVAKNPTNKKNRKGAKTVSDKDNSITPST